MEKTKSNKYWENRKEWLIYHQMESADRTADRIGKLYHRAYLEIEKKMNNVLDRFAFKYRMSREQALDILSRLNNRNDVDELIKELRLHGDNIDIKELSMMMDSPSYWYRINALKDTMAEVDTVMKLVYNNELAVSTEHYKKAANDSFLKNTYTLQQQMGYGNKVSILPPETVSKLLKSKWSGANYSKRIWNNTTTLAGDLKTELLTSVLMGRTESETMKIFLNKFAVGANNARRLIRTESAYIYNQMDTEAYKESGIEYYRFVATLDLKTSKVCQELDGKVFKTTDAQVGVNFPPMHPWCRSVTIANIDDNTLKTLNRRAEKEKVPADMTYKEWENKFVVDDNLDLQEEKHGDILKKPKHLVVDRPIIEQETVIKEAMAYGEKLLKNPELIQYDNGEPVSNYINKQIGYDALPRIVDDDEFRRLSKDKKILYRGVTDYKDISAKEMVNQFKTGKFYCGRGIYGNGTYADYDKNVANYYAYNSGSTSNGEIMEMLLSDDAKTISFLDIYMEYEKTGIPKLPIDKRTAYQDIISNVGVYAAIKGYDAILLDGFQNKQHVIILNRSKIIIRG